MKKLVVIIGAHTSVGRALAEALGDRAIEAEIVRATTTNNIEADLELLDAASLEKADLMLLTASDDFAQKLAAGASRLSAPLVDLAGVLPRSVPLLFPTLERDIRKRLPGAGPLRVPLGMLGAVATALDALSPFGLRRARVVTFEGAAGLDKPGIEELSAQARGIFTSQEVEPTVFHAPLAFSVLSGVAGDPFEPEERFAADVRSALSNSTLELSVMRTRVPVFTGEGASLVVELEDPPTMEVVVDALSEARGLRAAKHSAPGTLEAVDRDHALFGRVRLDRNVCDLWLSADRLRFGAAFPGALIAEALLGSD